MKIQAIYKISSKKTGQFYIGGTIYFQDRKNHHLNMFKWGNHQNSNLADHVKKFGIDDLEFSIIEIVDLKQNLRKREQFYLDTLKPQFNINKNAESPLGRKTKESVKEKLREKRKDFIFPEYAKEKVRLNSTDSKIVLNIETGIFYESIKEAAFTAKIKTSKFSRILNGKYQNNTSFILVDDKEPKDPFNNNRYQTGYKIILNFETGIYYNGAIEASKSINLHEVPFRNWMKNGLIPFKQV